MSNTIESLLPSGWQSSADEELFDVIGGFAAFNTEKATRPIS